MPESTERTSVTVESRNAFPFPLFLYGVLFFFSGLINTFHIQSIIYSGYIRVSPTLWGLINLYLLRYTFTWTGIIVSISGILNVASAVLVFVRNQHTRKVAYANLVVGVLVGILCLIDQGADRYTTFWENYGNFIIFMGVNAVWFYYFKKNEFLP